jgi:hypothetical protein
MLCCSICLFGSSAGIAQTSGGVIAGPPESPADGKFRIYSDWTVFEHPRYGYELPVPPGVRAVGVPEKATETKFVSEDGEFTMTAWGGSSPDFPPRIMESQWKEARSHWGRSISYERKGRSWFVVSGVDRKGTEFYQKFMVHGDQVATFTLTYPHSRLREFDSWVSTIGDRFSIVFDSLGGPPDPAPVAAETRLAAGRSSVDREGVVSQTQPVPPSIQLAPPAEKETPKTAEARNSLPKVDLTPPKKETIEPPHQTAPEKPAVKDNPIQDDLPYGAPVAGKPGFVYSPYGEKKLVDAVDIPRGTKVKCPYTGKIFRVP